MHSMAAEYSQSASMSSMARIRLNTADGGLSAVSPLARVAGFATASAMLLAGCGGARTLPQSTQISESAQIGQAAAINIDTLQGRWRITTFDGVTPENTGDKPRGPSISFIGATYSADSGCNALSGLAALNGTRLYTMPGLQTEIGCQGPLLKQEATLVALLHAAPQIAIDQQGEITMTGGGHEVRLQRDAGAASRVAKPATAPIKPDTQFQIDAVDGASVRSSDKSESLSLAFGRANWLVQTACATLTGKWSQQGTTLETSQIVLERRRCKIDDEHIRQAVNSVFASSPTVASGPNGEIILAGGGHWVSGFRADKN